MIKCLLAANQIIMCNSDDNQESTTPSSSASSSLITCRFGSDCGDLLFESLLAFESHYHARHHHVCQQCRQRFPSSRWLELHLMERHDPMFAVLANTKKMVPVRLLSCRRYLNFLDCAVDYCLTIAKYCANFSSSV